MAQHDYNIANQTGANFRADLNNALSAIVSNNSGANEPSTMYAYEWWIDTSNDLLKLRNSANNAWITMPFSITADNTVDINAGTVNGITSFSFSSGATVTSILDEDNLASDSATALATQQSIKAYVDSQVTAQDLDITDGSSTIAIDLDSETLSLLGGTGVTSTASGNGVTFAIGQSVGTSDNVVFNQVTGALVGNASTATALATARTISGVSFDGTANITLDTDDIGEGSSNLYFTNARVDSRFDTRLATKTTDNLTEGSSNKYFTAERVDDQVNTLLTAGANISLTYDDTAGTLTIANTNSADITSVVAGDGLTGGGTAGDVTLAVGVDDSSIEINSDALRVKATGITNAMLAGSIANAKLANSSITVNSQAIALGGSHTFDTDDIGEGSSNLYYTDARANSAIDARVTNTFINNLSGVVADTSTALATARTITVAGDVVGSASFDGTSDISISTTIQANSVALGTDTTGNYIQTITGTANKITVSGSGSESADVTLTLPADVQIANDLTVAGDLTVNGDLTYLDTTNLKIEDNLFELNANLTGSPVNDSGMLINRGNQNNAIFMWDESNDKFALGLTTADGTSTGNITIASTSTLVSNLEGNVTGNVTGTVSSISNHSTSDLSEGTNLYYTDARFDTRLGTKTTDNLTEGSSNLYMTTERVQDIVGGMVTGNTETGITVTYDDSDGTLDFVVGTLNQDTTGNAATATALATARTIGGVSFDGTGNIDLAGVNTTGNQDTSGNAATATALATGRTIGMTGDVVWTSASFDGSGNVTGTATIQPNSVALSTDTTGDYVSTITAGTGLTSTGATSGEGVAHSLSVDAAQTQITSVGALSSLTVSGDLTVDTSTLKVDSSNDRVGIGTNSPSYKLHVNSGVDGISAGIAGNTYGIRFDNGGSFSSGMSTIHGVDDTLTGSYQPIMLNGSDVRFGTSATERMRIDSSGNVKLITANDTAGTSKFLTFGTNSFNRAGIKCTNAATYDGSLEFYTGNSSNFSERMRIDSAGGVGIGTTAATGYQLDITGQSGYDDILRLTAVGTNMGARINLTNTGTGVARINATNNSLALQTGGTERMRIDSTGLDVTGTINGVSILADTTNFVDSILISQNASTGTLSSASNNTGLGDSVFAALTSGTLNVGVGRRALTNNTTGALNISIGADAMFTNTTGGSNVAIGVDALFANTTGANNTAVGTSSLDANTTGTTNTAIGKDSLGANTTGSANTGLGHNALEANTTASDNTGVGKNALRANTTGGENTALGKDALSANTTGTNNLSLGSDTMLANTTGSNNVAVGYGALQVNSTADDNTAVGDRALFNNTTGANNSALGHDALKANTTGAQNTVVGSFALDANTTANNNVGIGYASLTSNTTGATNTSVGALSLQENTTADNNTAVGYLSSGANTTGFDNASLGSLALQSNTTGNSNTAIGKSALLANTTASNNTAIGSSALVTNTTGANNTALGHVALLLNTTASNNVALGALALAANTTGDNNVALGVQALDANTTAANNVAIGLNALGANTTGSLNVAVGSQTLDANTTGTENTAVGYQALGSCTTGNFNTAFGQGALDSVTTSSSNVALGWNAGHVISTGANNTCIGRSAGDSISTGSSNIIIGFVSDVSSGSANSQFVLGNGVTCVGDGNFTFGDGTSDSNIANGATTITAPSDIRLKEDIQDEEVGLNFINDLRPVTFLWKKEKDIPTNMKAYKEGSEKRTMNGKYNHGFIAQEVKEVIDNHNLKEGFDMWSEDEADGRQRVGDASLMPIMVKAVQQLSTQVEELKNEIKTLKGE